MNRWEVTETFFEGKRKYFSVKCTICGESSGRVRSDRLSKKKCACNRAPLGKPLKVGEKFGRLTVQGRAFSDNKNVYYTVKCECGKERQLQGSQLRSGSTNSCGCFLEEKRGNGREFHGKTGTKEYQVWLSIINRVTHPHKSTREWYYDKGIGISKEWRSSFLTFLKDMGECPEGFTIDRIDPDGDYCKENCRWASVALQSINKGLFKNNTSGRTGVIKNKNGRWVSRIYVGNDRIHLGTFDSFEEACEARELAEVKYRSHIKE